MASIQEIDRFYSLANALLLKLRLAESYATRPHELMAGDTGTRLVERRTALADLKGDIDKNLNNLQSTCKELEKAFGGALKELDGYEPTGYVISFGALKSATDAVLGWTQQTLVWLPTSDQQQARLTPSLIRKCGEIADGFPFESTQEAAIRKQLWHEQTVLKDRAERNGIENPPGQPGQPKIIPATDPEVAEFFRLKQLPGGDERDPIDICREIHASTNGAKPDSIKRKVNRFLKKHG